MQGNRTSVEFKPQRIDGYAGGKLSGGRVDFCHSGWPITDLGPDSLISVGLHSALEVYMDLTYTRHAADAGPDHQGPRRFYPGRLGSRGGAETSSQSA